MDVEATAPDLTSDIPAGEELPEDRLQDEYEENKEEEEHILDVSSQEGGQGLHLMDQKVDDEDDESFIPLSPIPLRGRYEVDDMPVVQEAASHLVTRASRVQG